MERAGEVEVNAAAVGAVSAYARINAAGQWVEREPPPILKEIAAALTCLWRRNV